MVLHDKRGVCHVWLGILKKLDKSLDSDSRSARLARIMNILKTILSKIVGTKTVEAAAQVPNTNPAEMTNVALQASSPAASDVDVAQVLTEMAAKSGATLNWRTSIVDLMKLIGMDSSLGARKELAAELGYEGDTSDSAAMNIWLHKQVMTKLAENGGKVPADLL
jgi:hypothetical protein